jgi:hypothetical protein
VTDPRWLEILKASGWQLFALSAAFLGFWLLIHFDFLPKIDLPSIVYGLPLAILVTLALAFVSAAESIFQKIIKWNEKRVLEIKRVEDNAKHRELFRDYVPYLTENEREILAYLYQNNQKTFVADMTGDLASTLYNRGLVRMLAKPGQGVSALSCTFEVPETTWDVMSDLDDKFARPKVNLGYRGRRPWHSR